MDEVLAVGDAEFQKKCLGKMGDVAKEGRTVLFVSHNMGAVNKLCNRSLWIESGRLLESGLTSDVVENYLTNNIEVKGEKFWKNGIANRGISEFRFYSIRVLDEKGFIVSNVDVCKNFWIEMKYKINERLPYCRIGFILKTVDGTVVFETYDSDNEEFIGYRSPGAYKARCAVPGNLLNKGKYIVSLNAGIPNVKNLASVEGVLQFSVEDTGAVGAFLHGLRQGVIRPLLKWKVESI